MTALAPPVRGPGRSVVSQLSVALALLALIPLLGPSTAGAQWTDRAQSAVESVPAGRADFAVTYHGAVVPWRQFLLRALPGEEVALEVRAPAEAVGAPPRASDRVPAGGYELRASDGSVERTGPRSWTWTAPDRAGLHRLVVTRRGQAWATRGGDVTSSAAAADSISLTAAVLVPLAEIRRGRVRGFRVGAYPEEVFRDLARYRKPRGFIRITREGADLPVSPHFRLGQFPVKRPAQRPTFTVLHERLLLKLELLVERAARRGVPPDDWRVLSAYRSPWYNRGIGRPRFSRHIFGDAADVYVDVDRDGRMDDLNGDGRVNVTDADVLYDIVDRMDADPSLSFLLGGLGKYRTTPTHGPFIHVDTRGYRARW